MADYKISPAFCRTRLAAVLCLGLLLTAAAPTSAKPSITAAEGRVEISNLDPPSWRPARVGDPLHPGDAIRTGPESRAELDLGDATVRLYANSVLRLPGDAFVEKSSRAVELREGQGLFDIMKRKLGQGFEVRTPEAVALVKGTRFSVGITSRLITVSVFQGLVGVRSTLQDLDREILVRPGFSAVGGHGQSFELLFDQMPDPWESWSDGLPEPLPARVRDGTPPAKIAVEQARELARQSVSSDVVRRAAERNPRLRAELEKHAVEARPARAAAAWELELSKDAEGELAERQQEPSLQVAQKALPDPVANEASQESAERLTQDVVQEIFEEAVGPPDPSCTTPPGFQVIEVDVMGAGGAASITFLDPTGSTVLATMPVPAFQSFMNNPVPAGLPPAVLQNYTDSGLTLQEYLQLLGSTL